MWERFHLVKFLHCLAFGNLISEQRWIKPNSGVCIGLNQGFPCLGPALGCLHSNIWGPSIPKTNLPPITNLWTSENRMDCDVIKRKIGLQSHKEEIAVICSWLDQLPEDVKVRLDPNESFSREDLQTGLMHLLIGLASNLLSNLLDGRMMIGLLNSRKLSYSYCLGRSNLSFGVYEFHMNYPRICLVIKPMLFK